jgi:putative acetyltransferase
VSQLSIKADDPRRADVVELLETHLNLMRSASPPEDVHALDVDGLTRPDISFYSVRDGNLLLGVGALRELEPTHGELKSMHTAYVARGRGIGRMMAIHLLDVSRERGYARVSLETGTMDEFAPARALYRSLGFEVCPPFGSYFESPNSVCMTLEFEP